MADPKRLYVVGAGAMGCLFGGLLAEGGLDVTLVDPWQEHVDAINGKGLRIVGIGYGALCFNYTQLARY